MSIDVFHGIRTLQGIYIHQMSCTRDYFYAKISLKEYFWQDFIGVWKITLLLKDPVWEKVATEKKEWKKWKNEKIMTFIVATNVVASRPLERRPTGMPTACAKSLKRINDKVDSVQSKCVCPGNILWQMSSWTLNIIPDFMYNDKLFST